MESTNVLHIDLPAHLGKVGAVSRQASVQHLARDFEESP